MPKKILVTGISGQSAAYLAARLLEQGHEVHGGLRRNASHNLWRLKHLGIDKDIQYKDFELLEYELSLQLLKGEQYDRVYNLAAQSFVGYSFNSPLYTYEVNALGVIRMLEVLRNHSPATRFYQASTSEMYGKITEPAQSETTPFYPRSPYAIAKLAAYWAVINARESYDIFASNGILFNHESPLRGEEFVTKKAVKHLVEISRGQRDCLKLGNIEAQRDWGYAKDYAIAMEKILEHHTADDFVVGTGEKHSVREFIELTCQHLELELEWKEGKTALETTGYSHKLNQTIISIDPAFFRPAEVEILLANSQKAAEQLNWTADTKFEQLVDIMVEYELQH